MDSVVLVEGVSPSGLEPTVSFSLTSVGRLESVPWHFPACALSLLSVAAESCESVLMKDQPCVQRWARPVTRHVSGPKPSVVSVTGALSEVTRT